MFSLFHFFFSFTFFIFYFFSFLFFPFSSFFLFLFPFFSFSSFSYFSPFFLPFFHTFFSFPSLILSLFLPSFLFSCLRSSIYHFFLLSLFTVFHFFLSFLFSFPFFIFFLLTFFSFLSLLFHRCLIFFLLLFSSNFFHFFSYFIPFLLLTWEELLLSSFVLILPVFNLSSHSSFFIFPSFLLYLQILCCLHLSSAFRLTFLDSMHLFFFFHPFLLLTWEVLLSSFVFMRLVSNLRSHSSFFFFLPFFLHIQILLLSSFVFLLSVSPSSLLLFLSLPFHPWLISSLFFLTCRSLCCLHLYSCLRSPLPPLSSPSRCAAASGASGGDKSRKETRRNFAQRHAWKQQVTGITALTHLPRHQHPRRLPRDSNLTRHPPAASQLIKQWWRSCPAEGGSQQRAAWRVQDRLPGRSAAAQRGTWHGASGGQRDSAILKSETGGTWGDFSDAPAVK